MNVAYWTPLMRAWDRMVTILFRPFDLGKWLVLAFVVWVARLLDGGGGGNGPGGGDHGGGGGGTGRMPDAESVLAALREAWHGIVRGYEWLLAHTAVTVLVFVIVPLVIAFILALVWVTSRFKLIYVDNVVWNRAAVIEPWHRLRRLGDSLFLFRVAFGLGTMFLGILLVGGMVALGVYSIASKAMPGLLGLGFLALLTTVFFVAVTYASLFLESFVIPIMYRFNVSVLEAWRTFLPYLSAYTAHFILYGLFVLLLFIAAGLGVVVVGVATCCIGCFVLWLPYVGTVALLPLLVTYRLFSLEFIGQFDPSLDVLAAARMQASAASSGTE